MTVDRRTDAGRSHGAVGRGRSSGLRPTATPQRSARPDHGARQDHRLSRRDRRDVDAQRGGVQGRATIFSVAYIAERANPKTRPVSFVWNGGPGGASWQLARAPLAQDDGEGPDEDPLCGVRGQPRQPDRRHRPGVHRCAGHRLQPLPLRGRQARSTGGRSPDGQAFAGLIAEWAEGAQPSGLARSIWWARATAVLAQASRRFLAARPKPMGLAGVAPSHRPWAAAAEPLRSRCWRCPASLATAHFYSRGLRARQPLQAVVRAAEAFADSPYAAAIAKGEVTDTLLDQAAGFTGLPRQTIVDAKLAPTLNSSAPGCWPTRASGWGTATARGTRSAARRNEDTVVTANDYDLHASIVGLRPTSWATPLSVPMCAIRSRRTASGTSSSPVRLCGEIYAPCRRGRRCSWSPATTT